MHGWCRDSRVHYPLEGALKRVDWLDGQWGDDEHDFAATLVTGLLEAGKKQNVERSVDLAVKAARRTVSMSDEQANLWTVITLVHVTESILSEATRHLLGTGETCQGLSAIAVELVACIEKRKVAVPDTTPDRAKNLLSVASGALRSATSVFRADPAAALLQGPAKEALATVLGAPLLTQGLPPLRAAVAGVMRTLSTEPRWREASSWMQTALVREAIANAATTVAREAHSTDDVSLRLIAGANARQIILAIRDVPEWISNRPSNNNSDRGIKLRNEARKMSDTKSPILQSIQDDANDAAWRLATNQFLKLAREPLVGLLQRHLGPEDQALRAKIAAFLETPVGNAVLGSLLSVGLTALPNSMGPNPQRLARELRIKAMTDAGDVVADVLMGPLRQVISTYLQGVPAGPEQLMQTPKPAGELSQGAPKLEVTTQTQVAVESKKDV